jgi:hypothetical protein
MTAQVSSDNSAAARSRGARLRAAAARGIPLGTILVTVADREAAQPTHLVKAGISCSP